MPRATKAAARNIKNRKVTDYGSVARKRELSEPEKKLYGELSYECQDYRKLPADHPKRIEVERTIAEADRRNKPGSYWINAKKESAK